MVARWIALVFLFLLSTSPVPYAWSAPCGDAGEFPAHAKRFRWIQAAPVIVIGTVVSTTVAERRTGIFTEYEFRVECVVRGSPPNPLVVRVLGGCVELGGTISKCQSPGSDGGDAFLEENRRMRLFLEPVAGTKSVFEEYGGAIGVQKVILPPSSTSPDVFATRRLRIPPTPELPAGAEGDGLRLGSVLLLAGAATAFRRFGVL